MTPDSPRPVGYRLAEFRVDVEERTLSRGRSIEIQDQPFELLLALLERPGRVVTREEIIGRLWPGDTYVDFERSLNTAVRKVRRALGERASAPRFVATVPKRGYRLLVTPETLLPDDGPAPPDVVMPAGVRPDAAAVPSARRWWSARPVRLAAALGAALFFVAVGMVLPRPGAPPAPPGCDGAAPGSSGRATSDGEAGAGASGPFRTCDTKPSAGSPGEPVPATTCQLTISSRPRSDAP